MGEKPDQGRDEGNNLALSKPKEGMAGLFTPGTPDRLQAARQEGGGYLTARTETRRTKNRGRGSNPPLFWFQRKTYERLVQALFGLNPQTSGELSLNCTSRASFQIFKVHGLDILI